MSGTAEIVLDPGSHETRIRPIPPPVPTPPVPAQGAVEVDGVVAGDPADADAAGGGAGELGADDIARRPVLGAVTISGLSPPSS